MTPPVSATTTSTTSHKIRKVIYGSLPRAVDLTYTILKQDHSKTLI
ncbi:hypothetical protein EVA_04616 [gut metagenome]|uniref:Uncharacterized protein n=1 Tax=gut metagenome TaxID=749906 RepID=J9GWA4_9ZZZZ